MNNPILLNKKIHWLNKCKTNIEKFKSEYKNNSIQENIKNIQLQYYNLYSLLKTINSNATLYGVDINLFKEKVNHG
jgi:hypothetical protein